MWEAVWRGWKTCEHERNTSYLEPLKVLSLGHSPATRLILGLLFNFESMSDCVSHRTRADVETTPRSLHRLAARPSKARTRSSFVIPSHTSSYSASQYFQYYDFKRHGTARAMQHSVIFLRCFKFSIISEIRCYCCQGKHQAAEILKIFFQNDGRWEPSPLKL